MTRKKKKSSPAENLIESLMDDLKEIQGEASIHKEAGAHIAESTNIQAAHIWHDLEKGLSNNIDDSEFPGGEAGGSADYSSAEEEGDYSSSDEDSSPYEGSVVRDESAGPVDFPEGFSIEELPSAAEERFSGPSAGEDGYQGPEAYGGYQSAEDLEVAPPAPLRPEIYADEDSTRPVYNNSAPSAEDKEDKTVSLQPESSAAMSSVLSKTDADKTIAVEGFANAWGAKRKPADVDVKVSIGGFRGARGSAANVMTSLDASLAQAENLKIAQQRILELEKEVETLRAENEELASAGEIIHNRADDLGVRITALEKEKQEIQESNQSEILILKGNLQYKESEVAKARIKIEELETRLKSDFKKIRVRERELENRLELLRAEKSALIRSKDEYILDLKRKIDQLSMELDNYRKKCLELNKTLDANQDQVKRTERALRLALSNLEAKEENTVPLKKAE